MLSAGSLQFNSRFSDLLESSRKPDDDILVIPKKTVKKRSVSGIRSNSEMKFVNVEPPEIVSSRSSARSNPNKIPYPERIPSKINDLKRDCNDYMENDQIKKYQAATQEIDRLALQYQQYIKQKIEDGIVNKYNEETARIQRDMMVEHKKLLEARKKKIQQMKDHVVQLQQKHSNQIKEYITKWKGDIKKRSYNRASNELRILYMEQEKLKDSKRFQEMKDVQAQIDARLAYEQDRNEHQMMHDFKDGLNMLINAQAEELKSLQIANRHKIADLDFEDKKLIELFTKRLQKASVNANNTNMSTEFKRAVQKDILMSRSQPLATPRSAKPPVISVCDCKYNSVPIRQPSANFSLPKLTYSLC